MRIIILIIGMFAIYLEERSLRQSQLLETHRSASASVQGTANAPEYAIFLQ
ncbi:hypothetical protein PI95_027540 [Hassallia byssoidea VB512170]|uniref:Uncharacterized protein n=1 Tax=Hassallia byssoidea VB512170 TaxID=1304833 RepID=A0A846HF69_9CYAN|nr:hypothetical protein [Hassalia byssoidea]NEU76177.1 hypothetical protein [Hassalia byssoidea VB512170]